MPKNVLEIWPQLIPVFVGIQVLLGLALAFSFRYRTGAESGRKGHRDEEGEAERVSPDGWIESFAGRIEEAGGGFPLMGRIIIIVTLIWYFAYLLLFWAPK